MFAKVDPNVDTTAFEANDIVLKRHQGQAAGAGIRVNAHSSGILTAERVAFPPNATGRNLGDGTFAIDYRVPATPATNLRAFGSFTVGNAGRCLIIAPLIGTMRVAAPTAGNC
jgi:hypothetical protein